jgi:hypothetical protein
LLASTTQLSREATVYSQLNYAIVQQRHAELAQAAQRARFIGDAKRDAGRQPTTVLNRIRRRITFTGAPVTPRANGDIA